VIQKCSSDKIFHSSYFITQEKHADSSYFDLQLKSIARKTALHEGDVGAQQQQQQQQHHYRLSLT
jgi:hypothetical protein